MKDFLLAFIPIFVVVDPVGILPIFYSMTHGLKLKEKERIIVQSLTTAMSVAVGFIFLGSIVFHILGILMEDFMIAGGLILFCIAIIDIINPNKPQRLSSSDLGAVPIGTPLVVGPAVLTTCLMMVDQHGVIATLLAVFLNILIVGCVFTFADKLMKILGPSGARVLSKLMALLLAAIAIMMIRKGLFRIFALTVSP